MPKAPKPIARALKRPVLAQAAYSPALGALLRIAGPAYARLALRLRSTDFVHGERLVEAFRDFQEGRSRLILAFRHPYGDEAQLFTLAFDLRLAIEARKIGRPLPRRPHATFVHGYEVPFWSGPLVRWLLPRVGALPVYHVRYVGESVRRLRRALVDGEFPVALAPEGQVSYRSETVPRLEQGTARFAFWCAEDLAKAGRVEKVVVLPLSVHVRHEESDASSLGALLGGIERGCALDPGPRGGEVGRIALAERMEMIDERLISLAEDYYGLSRRAARGGKSSLDPTVREARRSALIGEALRRGEGTLGIEPEGDPISRVYRIRQAGWDRIYPEASAGTASPLERRLADRMAGEAWYAMRHMEFVDLFYYLDAAYTARTEAGGTPSFDRLVECGYSLADLASRLTGGDISHRPNVLAKRATIVVAPPLELGSRLDGYRKDSRGTLERATADLEALFMGCIEEYRHGH
jgi:hypothetical protein